jgi:hypothetical protein
LDILLGNVGAGACRMTLNGGILGIPRASGLGLWAFHAEIKMGVQLDGFDSSFFSYSTIQYYLWYRLILGAYAVIPGSLDLITLR